MFSRVTFLPSLAYNLLRNRWSSWNWFDRIDETVILGALPFRGPVTDKLINSENVRYVVSMNENFELRYFVTNRDEWKLKFDVEFLQLETPDILHSPSQTKLEIGVDLLMELSRISPITGTISSSELFTRTKRKHSVNNCGGQSMIFPWKIKNNGQYLLPEALNQPTIWDSDREDENFNDCSNNNLPMAPSTSVYVHCKAGRTRSATLVACYLIKRYNLTPPEAVQFLKERRVQVFLHTKQWKAIETFFERFRNTRQVPINNNSNCDKTTTTTTQQVKQQSIIDV